MYFQNGLASYFHPIDLWEQFHGNGKIKYSIKFKFKSACMNTWLFVLPMPQIQNRLEIGTDTISKFQSNMRENHQNRK